MKITVFNGSPRIKGNTEILLEEALKAIDMPKHTVRLFRLNEMDIKPCQDCGGCDNTGVCIIKDDMESIYKAIRETDRIILASPIFFSGLSAQSKIMIDRCQAFWCEKYLLKKEIPQGIYGRRGLLILVGGMKKDTGIRCGEAQATAFFRSISIPYHETLGFTGIDRKGEILKHPDVLEKAYETTKRLTND
ncbi:MAG: flavodoxin family protein [Syntrophorhabdales bacterium]|nr:flavodoxin family protein [Syntrophorhabdales bacterium]